MAKKKESCKSECVSKTKVKVPKPAKNELPKR